ncbi:hypothetical protein BpHYR1_032743 [Brachionus plicatilis]|uniref:Uncharacterized protein n=1 Tax=Brachionus plicatilis TaxID=10195 RepID=A0A3M7P3M0_BRAPC|nr:hypothetical protein BpHYR1_032743 [Brachionus plicatilis]
MINIRISSLLPVKTKKNKFLIKPVYPIFLQKKLKVEKLLSVPEDSILLNLPKITKIEILLKYGI